MNRPRILLLDGQEREPWYRELRATVDADWEAGSDPDILERAASTVDLAIVNDERAIPYICLAVCELARQNVPTLHIVDGIVEWRNTWENPLYSIGSELAMPMFQPSLCHKIACLGRSQARIFESWGNLGKCEIVGALRLDAMRERRPRRRQAGDPWNVLVITAKMPGFTPEQRKRAHQSLADLKAWFDAHPRINDSDIRPIWRLTDGLDRELSVDNVLRNTFGTELAEILEQADAMISTPSTAMLEGMLQGIPVAALDYNNVPHYVPSAWSISAPQHLDDVLFQLISPPRVRMLHQDTILHDCLECRTPAEPRLNQLIAEMVYWGRHCRSSAMALQLPFQILANPWGIHHRPEEKFELRTLYPDHSVFGELDRASLQVEVGHARREIARRDLAARQAEEERAALVESCNAMAQARETLCAKYQESLARQKQAEQDLHEAKSLNARLHAELERQRQEIASQSRTISCLSSQLKSLNDELKTLNDQMYSLEHSRIVGPAIRVRRGLGKVVAGTIHSRKKAS